MGVVFRGYDPVIDRLVALKTVVLPETLSPSERETFLKRFFLEARIAGKLTHANIVITYDAATDEATRIPFIAMELIDGESLNQHLEKRGRLSWKEAVDIVISVAEALDYAHRNDIVHRDIKPANILLTGAGTPKITDFGIAKLPAANLTHTGVVLGTPYFMSPEQLLGETVDGRSDLFSLGGLLYNLISGQPPFQGAELAIISSMVLHKDPPPLSEIAPQVPADLDGVIACVLAKSVENRYGTGREFAEELKRVRQGIKPRRVLDPGQKTQAQSTVSKVQPNVSPERPERTGPELGKSAKRLGEKIRTSAKLHQRFVIALVVSCLGFGALLFRQNISQWVLYYQAKWAAESGDYLISESKLEELLEKDPEDESASELLSEVSLSLLQPHLPFAFTARHDHRIGNCTGNLTLHEWGVEYSSNKHGVWRWTFDQMFDMWRDNQWSFSLETNEDDMLGLLASKRYNFTMMSGPLEEEYWKRYRRLLK